MPNNTEKLYIKTRSLFNLRAYQLLREEYTSRLAKILLSDKANCYFFNIPLVKTSISFKGIASKSSFIHGENLIGGFYDSNKVEQAIDVALAILHNLYETKDSSPKMLLLSLIYKPYRIFKVFFFLIIKRNLSKEQRKIFFKLLIKYLFTKNHELVLVHGNLNGGNILVDYKNRIIGVIDLELLHFGSPVIDFAAIWLTIYICSPNLATNFFYKAQRHLPYLSIDKNLGLIMVELLIESYLMIFKAHKLGNEKLEKSSMNLLDKLFALEDFLLLLRL